MTQFRTWKSLLTILNLLNIGDPPNGQYESGRFSPRFFMLALLVFLVFVLSACSLFRSDQNDANTGAENPLSGEATLTCDKDCSDMGQCGTSDSGKMVLLNTSGPATLNHNMAVPEGTTVLIDHEEARPAVQLNTGEQTRVSYYFVNVPDRGPGWVAGWCLAQ